MGTLSLDTITTQFYNAGVHYSAAIQPYALKLFFTLFLIDIIVTWIQYTAEGQLDPSFFLGRMLKHVLSGGFVYLMIVNRFTASASEGYFTNVIRIGVKLLFFYAVLAIGMQIVTQWEAALAAACKPVTTALPMVMSYYVPPSKIMTTICSAT